MLYFNSRLSHHIYNDRENISAKKGMSLDELIVSGRSKLIRMIYKQGEYTQINLIIYKFKTMIEIQ